MDALTFSFSLAGLYLGLGLCFALWFLSLGAAKRDTAVDGSSLAMRLIWLPACLVLWPLLLRQGPGQGRLRPLKRGQRLIWVLLAMGVPLLFVLALRAFPQFPFQTWP